MDKKSFYFRTKVIFALTREWRSDSRVVIGISSSLSSARAPSGVPLVRRARAPRPPPRSRLRCLAGPAPSTPRSSPRSFVRASCRPPAPRRFASRRRVSAAAPALAIALASSFARDRRPAVLAPDLRIFASPPRPPPRRTRPRPPRPPPSPPRPRSRPRPRARRRRTCWRPFATSSIPISARTS